MFSVVCIDPFGAVGLESRSGDKLRETRSGLEVRFGDSRLEKRMAYPRNGTEVPKGSRHVGGGVGRVLATLSSFFLIFAFAWGGGVLQ